MHLLNPFSTRSLLAGAAAALACLAIASPRPAETAPTATLPPFPPDKPAEWVCPQSPPAPTPEQIQAWCKAHPNRGQGARFPVAPATVSDLRAKNAFDDTLRSFLRKRAYRTLGWTADRSWRLTGPYVGPFGDGESYGVHPAVRVWYSPEAMDWLCAGRPDAGPKDGAVVVKEMHAIDPTALGIDPASDCMVVSKPPDQIEPTSWTVMVRQQGATHDGWYWANPTASGDGNPPILSEDKNT